MNFAPYMAPETSAWVVESLGHVLWQGTLVAGLAAIATLALRNRSAQSRYLVYCTAMVLAAGCLPLNLWILGSADRIEKPDVGPSVSLDSEAPLVAQEITATNPLNTSDSLSPIEARQTNDAAVNAVTEPLTSTLETTFFWEQAAQWTFAVYVVGIVAMVIRLLMGLYGSQRLRTSAQPIKDGNLHQVMVRLGEQLHLKVVPVRRLLGSRRDSADCGCRQTSNLIANSDPKRPDPGAG